MSANNNDDVTLPDDGQNDLSPMIEAEPQPSASGSNYKASISFLPNETNKTFKFKSVAEASQKFESDSKSLQEKSRGTLAKWRKRDRQNRNDKYRDEDMTNIELFSRLTENFDILEDKIKQQETSINANNNWSFLVRLLKFYDY